MRTVRQMIRREYISTPPAGQILRVFKMIRHTRSLISLGFPSGPGVSPHDLAGESFFHNTSTSGYPSRFLVFLFDSPFLVHTSYR